MKYVPLLAAVPPLTDDSLPVSEMFHSLQGEGRFAGTPAVFIRTKFCNLGCSWCDTRFTWDKEKLEPGETLSGTDIAARAKGLVPASSGIEETHVVLTGGEPMLHQEKLPELIGRLEKEGFG